MSILTTYKAAKSALTGTALLAALLAAPAVMQAQVTLFGAPTNFDVLNDTGQDAHGFEIELDGLTLADSVYVWPYSRYPHTIVAVPGGIVIRYASPYVNNQYSVTTIRPAAFNPTGGHSCVQGAIPGCEHYGYSPAYYAAQPTRTIYRWLCDDPQNPGTLIPAPGQIVQVPPVTVVVIPPAQPALPPVVDFQIPVPPPPPPPIPKPELQFGVAKWVKVLKNEVQHKVAVEELLEDNPVVPLDGNPAQVETPWKLLQFNPHSPNSGVLHNGGNLGQGAKAVVRKYEFYKYSGALDPANGKAICGGDGLCTEPQPGELGDFIGDQMAAANVGISSVTVVRSGAGSGSVTGGKINCGSSCTTPVALGTAVTLTAKAASNSVFAGWTGDCVGSLSTCTFNVSGENTVTAIFDVAPAGGGGGGAAGTFKISISKNGKGTVTTDPATASFASGTVVTLTATPDAGQPWVGWGGACAGTAPTCTLTMTSDKSVTANFR